MDDPPDIADIIAGEGLDRMIDKAGPACDCLKAIGHESRFLILCHLMAGRKSVSELEDLLSLRQATVSQQLSRLRSAGLVTPERDGKTIYYELTDEQPRRILETIFDLFCGPKAPDDPKT